MANKSCPRWRGWATACAVIAFLPHYAYAGEGAKYYHAPASEVMLLPRYCWAQYVGSIPDTPEYTISRDLCGVGTNHLCDGYLQVRRARKKWSDAAERNGELHGARGSFEYTLTAIKDFPNCPIRSDTEKALAEVTRLMQTVGAR